MQKVIQHLMGYLKNHLSSEDKAYRRYVGAPGPHRGLPVGVAAADRAPDAAQASLEPLPGARLGACAERSVGTPAGLPSSIPRGAGAEESRLA
jgi:hypothetical protein